MRSRYGLRHGALLIGLTLLIAAPAGRAVAQAPPPFVSGSTGEDGALAPVADVTLELPEDGVFHFTTITIPEGVAVRFRRNARNTPVTMLATGDCTIEGTIEIYGSDGAREDARGGEGGPGGGNGGSGGYAIGRLPGAPGEGAGGGQGGRSNGPRTEIGSGGGGGFATDGVVGYWTEQTVAFNGAGGPRYGSALLFPLAGGSGGGGGGARLESADTSAFIGGGGGGGGGALLIASSGVIRFGRLDPSTNQGRYAEIWAWGGDGDFGNLGASGGGGSGGAVRVVANAITGWVYVDTSAGYGYSSTQGVGGLGYIRFEAYDFGGFDPDLYGAITSTGEPTTTPLADAPLLRIASVAGVAAPASPRGSLHEPVDVALSSVPVGPVPVVIEAANIPAGTVVAVTVTPRTGAAATVSSSPLAGSTTASTATANVAIVAGTSLVTATATIELAGPMARRIVTGGETVAKIEVTARYGGATELHYVTRSGRRVRVG